MLPISRVSFIVTEIQNPLVKRKEVYLGKRFFTKAHTELFPPQKVTPYYFATSFEAQNKALQFAERDLKAIALINPNNRGLYTALNIARFSKPILDLILKMFKEMDLREEFDQMVRILYDYLGRYCTYSFLEELRVWMESPYDELEQWDRNAKYFVINGLPLLLGTITEFPVLIQEIGSPNID
ncbi:hypothetical protein EYC80_007777 [Monilinia laxa]|uniref:Uncharacterized protein n=1 Tax=Monilinia laxa TaxID=61186 RepID=A0A5N6JX54_MONLA|nr:hypothetical protein EYC80_007777 [Monilinia laxa]